jgi:uncharacterized protein
MVSESWEQGFAKAQYMVGLAFMAGKGVAWNALVGIDWQRKAAAQGFAAPQFALARTFHSSAEGEISRASTIETMRKAAAQGWSPAQLQFRTNAREGG